MEYNNKKFIIDTSFWISLLNHDDSNHKESLKYKNLAFNDQIMPDLVFYEILTVLKNKIKNEDLLKTFTDFATNRNQVNIKLYYENNREVLKYFIDEKNRSLSYTDSLLLYLSKEYHILTFDKNLRSRIKEAGGLLIK